MGAVEGLEKTKDYVYHLPFPTVDCHQECLMAGLKTVSWKKSFSEAWMNVIHCYIQLLSINPHTNRDVSSELPNILMRVKDGRVSLSTAVLTHVKET